MINPRNYQKASSFRGFTLVELLVVVTIIVILSSLVVGVTAFVQRKSAVDRAKVQMELMNLGLTKYAIEAGGWPSEEDKTGLILYRMLFGDGLGEDGIAGTADDGALDGSPDKGATIHLADLDPKSNKQKMLEFREGNIPSKVVDPWGNAWRFRALGDDNPDQQNPDFDLWSLGPDGKSKTPDDIKNW